MILKSGTIKRVHVDRRILAQNKRDGTNTPAITIQTSKGPSPLTDGPLIRHLKHDIQAYVGSYTDRR